MISNKPPSKSPITSKIIINHPHRKTSADDTNLTASKLENNKTTKSVTSTTLSDLISFKLNSGVGKSSIKSKSDKKIIVDWSILNKEYPGYQSTITSKKQTKHIKSYAANTYKGIARDYNEDRVVAIPWVKKPEKYSGVAWPLVSYFAVFDGHSGEKCANFLVENLWNYIINDTNFPVNVKSAIKNAFDLAEKNFTKEVLDQNNPKKVKDESGSCAVIALFVDHQWYVANVGDSRVWMSLENGKRCREITVDHKVINPTEFRRIKENGGMIYEDDGSDCDEKSKDTNVEKNYIKDYNLISSNSDSVYRVKPGGLAISRSFGDVSTKLPQLGGKQNVIIAQPDIYIIECKNMSQDFIWMGCDGIYDTIESQEILEIVWSSIHSGKANNDINEICVNACNLIIKTAMEKDSYDNVSVIIIALEGFEKYVNNQISKEKVKNTYAILDKNKK